MQPTTTFQAAQRLAVVVCLVFSAALLGVNAADSTATAFCRTSGSLVKVLASAVIPQPIDKAWARVRDFQKADFLLPATLSPANDLPGDQLGSMRFGNFPEGKMVLEELTALDDDNYIQSYRMYPNSGTNGNLSPNVSVVPFPICKHHGTFRLDPITLTNQTLITWKVTLLTTHVQQQLAQAAVTGLISGFVQQLAAWTGEAVV